jgi:hypothetical protein
MKKILTKLSAKAKWSILCLILGISIATSINGWVLREFENEVLDAIIEKINPSKTLKEEELIEKTIHTAYFLQERRTAVSGQHNFQSLKTKLFTSSLESFYIGTGACGYYSIFATRLLKKQGFRPKIVQQRVNGVWGAHITLAVPLKNGRLGLVDPLFDHVFKDTFGHIADIKSVEKHWKMYKSTLSPQYDKKYNYQEGYRHTNWDKLGFITKSIYHIGSFVIGKAAMDLVSLRAYFIDPYEIVFYLSVMISLLCILALWHLRKERF